jgi:hypothetical protein
MRMKSENIVMRWPALLGLCLCLVPLAACNNPEIEVYTVPPLPPRVIVPEGWQEVATSQMMRAQKQRFEIIAEGEDGNATAVATLTVLPGNKDMSLEQYLLINVNRWRRQLGLELLPKDARIEDHLQRMLALSETAWLMDANGTSPTNPGEPLRTVVVLHPLANATWIYKLSGDDAVVQRERAAFLKIVPDWK